jgi:hypothetical protein
MPRSLTLGVELPNALGAPPPPGAEDPHRRTSRAEALHHHTGPAGAPRRQHTRRPQDPPGPHGAAPAGIRLACGLVAAAICLWAQATAMFPDQIGPFQRSAPKTMVVPDRDLYDEYGLEATEQADYTAPDGRRFSALGWRMHDSTGAMALFEARRPSGAVTSDYADLAVRTSDGIIFTFGNYVFQVTGNVPEPAMIQPLFAHLPKLENSPLPLVYGILPKDGLVPNSERYILGPVSLERVDPAIPPSVAAFRNGAEGQSGKYQTSKGLMTLAVFAYPTPSMAREQAAEFQKLPGAVVKRTGPLVAVTINPPDPDAAERVLGRINYQASVTLNENTPASQAKGLASLILNIFVLAGILLGICIVGGIGFAAFRIVSRKFWRKEDPYAMIVLDIGKTAGRKT